MSKKSIFAFILVLTLLAGLMTTAAYADGETADAPIKMDYHNIDASVYDGAWVDTGLGFDVYLPVDWILVNIPAEQAAAGLAFQAGEEGGGANMTVTLTKTPDGYDLDRLAQELAATTTTAAYADLNGIPGVIFDNMDTMVSGFGMLTDNNGLITGVISAPSDDQYEAYKPFIKNMLLSVSPTMPTLNWKDVEDDAKEIDPDGAFVTIDELQTKLWVSSILQQQELTEEDVEDSCYAYFEDAAQEVGFAVFYYEDCTMDEYAEEIREYDNCTEPKMGAINGYKSFSYTNTEYDSMGVVLSSGKDCMEFVFWPESDENFSVLAALMCASIMDA